MNDRSFENREGTLEEIKSLFFNTLYLWIAAFVSPLVFSYHDFLEALYAFNDILITYHFFFFALILALVVSI